MTPLFIFILGLYLGPLFIAVPSPPALSSLTQSPRCPRTAPTEPAHKSRLRRLSLHTQIRGPIVRLPHIVILKVTVSILLRFAYAIKKSSMAFARRDSNRTKRDSQRPFEPRHNGPHCESDGSGEKGSDCSTRVCLFVAPFSSSASLWLLLCDDYKNYGQKENEELAKKRKMNQLQWIRCRSLWIASECANYNACGRRITRHRLNQEDFFRSGNRFQADRSTRDSSALPVALCLM